MSNLVELKDRVRRIREMFVYFNNAALLAGAELQCAAEAAGDEVSLEEWRRLLAEVREFSSAAENLSAPRLRETAHRRAGKTLTDVACHRDCAACLPSGSLLN